MFKHLLHYLQFDPLCTSRLSITYKYISALYELQRAFCQPNQYHDTNSELWGIRFFAFSREEENKSNKFQYVIVYGVL